MPQTPSRSHEDFTDFRLTPLATVKGVSSHLEKALRRLGLETVEDALYHLPLRYRDFRQLRKISHLRTDTTEIFCGKVLAAGAVRTGRGRSFFEAVVSDGTGEVRLKWFHFRGDWLKKRFRPGRRAVFVAEISSFGRFLEASHPEAYFFDSVPLSDFAASGKSPLGRILPVYPLTQGLQQTRAVEFFQRLAREFAPRYPSAIPPHLRSERKLLPAGDALYRLHCPPAEGAFDELLRDIESARRSLVYDEFFFLQLGLLQRRNQMEQVSIPTTEIRHRYTKGVLKELPFALTAAQRKVLGEIKIDLQSGSAMNRLVQGDVGSGKTLVALLCALMVIEQGGQVAVVAPTEVLAEQHFRFFSQWLEKQGLKTCLLTGRHRGKERRGLLAALSSGEINLVVGTHALFQPDVVFPKLGLAVIDEQHRFGVRQRQEIRKKGDAPHILVMTATPIPRTLSLVCYGDLAVSVIDELPSGRRPIETLLFPEGRRDQVYERIQGELDKGRQGYVIYPLVEESEKTDLAAATEGAQRLSSQFPRHCVALLHGKMRPEEKEAVMTAFKEGRIDLLVATTVIEVGIDVPNASVMLIEHPERFGLAQLHQLRGRVGRGEHASRCLLLYPEEISEEGRARIEIFARHHSGFDIAEADFDLRGPGDLLGIRQSGLPDFRIANLVKDRELLELSRKDAFSLNRENLTQEMSSELSRRWRGRLSLLEVG